MEEEKILSEEVVHSVEVKTKRESNNTPEIVRLTPTGKISHAKTRVYTQRYRKEWEHMTDFKDWLTSVPYQATRAFCKFCQRNLHAHRLSLLKHMCTLKHQRAAIQYNKRHAISNQQDEETSNDMNYVVERLDADDEDEEDDANFEEATYIQEGEEVSIESEVQEEIIEEVETVIEPPISKKIRLQKEPRQDPLAQAMAHVQSDYLTESDEPIELEMADETDENIEEDEKYEVLKYENIENSKNEFEIQKNLLNKSRKCIMNDDIQKSMNSNNEDVKTKISLMDNKTSITADNSKKVYYFSTGGKSYTLVKSKLPQILLNQLNDKNFSVFAKSTKSDIKNCKDLITQLNTTTASTSQESTNKHNCLVTSTPSVVTSKSVLLKKPIVSTHVLETSRGIPVCGLQVSLYKLQDGRWTFVHESITTASGNCNNFLSTNKTNLSTGRYKLHYDVEKYYKMRKVATIYPFIEIVFDIKDPNSSYHIPLLLSPFSYSTYKDSHR